MAGEAFGLGKADVKAELAKFGQTLRPDATFHTIRPPMAGEYAGVVLLERVVEGVTPEYCTHGYATCVSCRHLCWLGHETEKVFRQSDIYPLCLDCAPTVIPEGTMPTGHLQDHRRAYGPHAD